MPVVFVFACGSPAGGAPDRFSGTWTLNDGRTIPIRPFLGLIGMPPSEPGIHSTIPPRASGGNLAASKNIGKAIAERAKAKGITKVVFDRGGYLYHGRIKALADAARESGLQF